MMKKFRLVQLKLKNFKGIKEFVLNANGNDLVILGRNETGKTTLFDAFTWLLFGRDSLNRTKFEIKTLDEEGNVSQHGINHGVEGTFKLNEKTITFKRVYKEQWTKHRGSAKKIFTGHTTDYFIDDIPVKKKEYDETVSQIVPDDIFRLLTNPLYFNEHLDPKSRRKILLNMIDDVSDKDVAEHSKNKDLANLIEKLKGTDVEKYQLSVREKQRKINEEIERIPIRIDEIQLSFPDMTGLDKEKTEREMESIELLIEEKHKEINNIKSGAQVGIYEKQLSDIDVELSKIRNAHEFQSNDEIYRLKASLQEKESNIMLFNSKIDSLKQHIEFNSSQIEKHSKHLDLLRKEWIEVDNSAFEYDDELKCPTCNQELPQEQVEEARMKAEREFNEKKAVKLESIVEEAEGTKKHIETLKDDIERTEHNIKNHNKEIELNKNKVEKLKQEIESLERNKTDISEIEEYQKKLKERASVTQKIDDIKASVEDSIKHIRKDIKELENEKKRIQSNLNKFEIAKKSEARLKELEEKERKLSNDYNKLEKELYLTEEFIRSKVDLLEERINSKFKYARFKLFEKQVNGGLREICETTYKGVPFNSGLNNAARINVGLDIINTLNQHYEIYVPVFIDNRESVTDLIEIDTQTISLSVSETAYELEVSNDIREVI